MTALVMNKQVSFSLFLLIVLFSLNVNSAPDGGELYGRHCSACHGDKGEGGVGVPLSLPSFLNSVLNEYLKKTIRLGRSGRVMPAFEYLSDAQVNAIAALIAVGVDMFFD